MPKTKICTKYLFNTRNFPYCEQVESWKEDHGRGLGETGIGITSVLRESETITLPRKTWKVSDDQRYGEFIHWQGSILRSLLRDVYHELDKNMPPDLRI